MPNIGYIATIFLMYVASSIHEMDISKAAKTEATVLFSLVPIIYFVCLYYHSTRTLGNKNILSISINWSRQTYLERHLYCLGLTIVLIAFEAMVTDTLALTDGFGLVATYILMSAFKVTIKGEHEEEA